MEEKGAEPRVFLIDDDPFFSSMASSLLQELGYVVEMSASAEEFLARPPYHGVGCILLDLVLPGLSGTSLLDSLRDWPLCTPIIVLTGNGDIPATVQSLKNGALNFLTKPIEREELQRSISEAIDLSRRIQPFCQRLLTLTPREREVLEGILNGLLNKQIALRLGISEKTTKIHRGRLMEKLNVRSLPELVRLWVECRFPWPASPEPSSRWPCRYCLENRQDHQTPAPTQPRKIP
ncbi:MAG: DNA-binding response regulator [Candidatus Ozemobacter sibiricus]|uniref:DNA-binding response regulator n=1 Tax=Candidatus Ozemobacter sibiricus TaxID=2268124 RepID=A0A367ZK60_9BACT|nr:MAG: DNA-binding response regulator [Candidatus Ozemobacter sibiricus]